MVKTLEVFWDALVEMEKRERFGIFHEYNFYSGITVSFVVTSIYRKVFGLLQPSPLETICWTVQSEGL